MRILFIGPVLPQSAETRVRYLSNAGNRFQLNLIQALQNNGHEVILCSYTGFPIEEDYADEIKLCTDNDVSLVTRDETYICKGIEGYYAVARFRGCYEKKIDTAKPDIVLCYNPLYAWFKLPRYAKRAGVRTILVFADYAGEENFKGKFSPADILRRIKSRMELKCVQCFDGVVGLSEGVRRLLVKGQSFLHMEGGIMASKWADFDCPDIESPVKVFMYSGSLSEQVGINIAVEAFERIDRPDTELYITGFGNMEGWVRDKAKENDRIHFLGRLEYDEYISLLKKSHILLNPRNMSIPENANNFPSKLLEYLATGRMIVSTRFAGWQKFEHNAYFTESEVEDFSRGMELALSEYETGAKDIFLRNRKMAEDFDWNAQAKRIVEFACG